MRLLLLAASGLLPLLLVLAWGVNHLVEERRVAAERSVQELSRALAIAIDAELRSTLLLLENMGTFDELERGDVRGFYIDARRMTEQLGWRQISLADGEGRVLMRTSDPIGASSPVPVEPRSLALVVQTLKPVITGVIETPAFKSDAFNVRMPVIRSGKLVYVVTAMLPTDTILNVLMRQNVPAGSVSSVFDASSRRIARSRQVDSPYPSESLQALLDRGGSEGVGRTATREGIENYTGFARLRESGWTVVVGTSVAQANQGLYDLLRVVALGLAGSLALSVLLAYVLSRRVLAPIDDLKEGAAALGRGDPVHLPALRVAELDTVAEALRAAAVDRDRAAARINEALRQAEEANRSKDQFLAVLGHELRNPLAPISNAVHLMALKGDTGVEAERRIIERQLVHVTRLVDDLLDVSRITGGRLSIRHEPVRLAQVLGQVADTIRRSMHRRSLAIDFGPGTQDAWVAGDEVRLAQVFNNLLVNAVKFTAPGEAIRVRASLRDGHAQVVVEDEGIGITAADLDHIFDLFYQAPQNIDRSQGGLGLGLPIVRSLVEMHGGSVQAESEGAGHGTRITVTLPLCEAPAASADAAAHPAAAGGGRVLVVDDNEDAADTCASLLSMSGYTTRVAYTPEAALQQLGEFLPDVAILDIGLPGMSGYELARLMRAAPHGWSGRLVAMTGYGQASDLAAAEEAGFDAHLTKPADANDILDLVERLVRTGAEA